MCISSLLKEQSTGRHSRPTRIHYPDLEPASHRSLLLFLNAMCLAEKQQIKYSLWFDPIAIEPTTYCTRDQTSTLTVTPAMRYCQVV